MSPPTEIAIVGLAGIYPDARNPGELWENVLARRRAFRRLPSERLNAADYFSPDRSAADKTYAFEAAVIEGYEFDRTAFQVAGSVFRSADLTHWLALDVAARALADAGFANGEGLPRELTGVLLGNTLTGEFSRASVMRLRWPYVRRVLESALTGEGWEPPQRAAFLERLEIQYKLPFPPVAEETLAGGLSNTIAGRICNHFDLKGGGYTVDGACASSLLAVANACSALAAGDLDVALAGGVDLSLDPFELVGFAKTGALAPERMRIYDLDSAGFWPGEGCGFAVLMRLADAREQKRRIYSVIRGWGISSDGSGGITRPELAGQLEALRRAYRRAGFNINSVTYFEGHGTGTAVGDATELQALSTARRDTGESVTTAVIGSIKANIGHTKAAAGIAGLIKATLALHSQILPPTTGCERPHQELAGADAVLRPLAEPEPWPADRPLRAGVSAMGFGGINVHVVLEGASEDRRRVLGVREQRLAASAQDAELFLFGGPGPEEILRQVAHVLTFAARLSLAEMGDLAATLAGFVPAGGPRAAVVASTPGELSARLSALKQTLANDAHPVLEPSAGIFIGSGSGRLRLGLLFPGQGSLARHGPGHCGRRFAEVRDLYATANLPAGEVTATDVAQPAITTASLAGLRVLRRWGIEADVAVGHSLGELGALCWAGAFSEAALGRLAATRGRAMAELTGPTGAMFAIAAPAAVVARLLDGAAVSLVGLNSPRQTVIAGAEAAVTAVADRARAEGLRVSRLPVSHAFHTPWVAAAAPRLQEQLDREQWQPLQRPVSSTVVGRRLGPEDDLKELLVRQLTAPVRFMEAVEQAGKVDLWIEVGPGEVLSGLVRDFTPAPAISLDVGGPSLIGLLRAVGAAFVLGAELDPRALFADRFVRPFDLNWRPKFFQNPCELAPEVFAADSALSRESGARNGADDREKTVLAEPAAVPPAPLELFRRLVAERAELPLTEVRDDRRLLADLHLNSISVGQLVAEAARQLRLKPLTSLTDFARATVAEVALALTELGARNESAAEGGDVGLPAGVDSWVRPFRMEWVESPRPLAAEPVGIGGNNGDPGWTVIAPAGHPLGERLRERFSQANGRGTVVCWPEQNGDSMIGPLLTAAQRALASGEPFVLVQSRRGLGSFARSLHLEAPHLTTCVIELPFDDARAVAWAVQEAMAARGHVDVRYDANGRRHEPRLKALPLAEPVGDWPVGPGDVLLVTGGARGIGAECALALARQTGVRLVLLGRSSAEPDSEVANNLARMAALNIKAVYYPVDLTDATAVKTALAGARRDVGTITAFLHAAGVNVPQSITTLDEAAFRRTLAPKINGWVHVMAALDPGALRLCLSFGSIIGRAGLQGQADYAVANEWLTHQLEDFQVAFPACRCLALEWSVWSGVGMGAKLGRLELLRQNGITPISPEAGTELLGNLLRRPLPVTAVVVTGRFGQWPTLQLDQRDLPFQRFLERPRVHYPGVELIVDFTLASETDPYLDEHVYQGERLFPAVLGLEALAQAARGLTGADEPPTFEQVEFLRPVVVPRQRSLIVRVAALVRRPGVVELALRSEATGFAIDHFRAVCRFDDARERLPAAAPPSLERRPLDRGAPLSVDPTRDLYEDLLFHTGRFRRVKNYRILHARECVAQVEPDLATNWFGAYLPPELVLGDPGVRDAALHAIQACIPHARILPSGVKRIVIGRLPCLQSGRPPGGAAPALFLHAREVRHEGSSFTYDVELTDESGVVLERWEELELRQVDELKHRGPWNEAVLAAQLERRLETAFPAAGIAVRLERTGGESPASGVGPARLQRADGKPENVAGLHLSRSHSGTLTLTVTSPGVVSGDLERIRERTRTEWEGLLGTGRMRLADRLTADHGEDLDAAGTRVWSAGECLKKAGCLGDAPLVLEAGGTEGTQLLRSGVHDLASWMVQIHGEPDRFIITVLTKRSTPDVGQVPRGGRPTI